MNKKRDCWATPPDFFAAVNKYFRFEWDVCAAPETAKCKNFYTPEDNGLAQSWHGFTCWCNPGYSNAAPWFDKAIYEAENSGATTVILTHACTGAAWWQDRAPYAESVWLVTPRINFVPPEGIKQSSNSRDSILTVYTPDGLNPEKDPTIKFFNWKKEIEK